MTDKKTIPPALAEASKKTGRNSGTRKFTKKEVVAALAKAGTKLGAANILGCHRDTITTYMRRDPEIADAVHEARENLIDIAESGLMRNVSDRHPASIFFTLKTLGKDRGYVERTETTGKDGAPLDSDVKVTFVNAEKKDD